MGSSYTPKHTTLLWRLPSRQHTKQNLPSFAVDGEWRPFELPTRLPSNSAHATGGHVFCHPLDSSDFFQISDVVSGLVYLHDSNIAHGDLKAVNFGSHSMRQVLASYIFDRKIF